MMVRHVSDRNTRAALATLWGYAGLPPTQLAAVVGATMTAAYHEHGGWYPEGGSQAISQALAQVLRQRGGEIRFGQLVTGLDLDQDRVVAVTTGDGVRLEGSVFVSNASAPTTMVDLVGRALLPADYIDKVDQPSKPFATFSVYLGLGRDLFAEQGLAHELFVDPALDPDAAWRASQEGDWVHAALAVTDYTRVDPGCAPEGHGVVVVTTQAPWDYEDVWGTGGDLEGYHQNARYLRLKEQVADVLVARADEAVPGLADAIRLR
jgi:prolycopene isomerase